MQRRSKYAFTGMADRIDPDFAPYDDVLFLALYWGGGRVSALWELIERCDWLDRSIPTTGEFDGGLNRLLAASLLAKHRTGFCIPSKVIRKFHALRRRRRRDRYVMAKQFVHSAGPLKVVRRRVTIRRADYETAYAEYRRMFAAACEKAGL